MNGTDVLVKIGNDIIGSQRDCTFGEKNAEIDMSSKDGRAKKVLAGRYTADITMDSLYVPNDNAYLALKSALRNGTMVTVVRQEEGSDLEEAQAIVTDLSEKAPDQAAATVSIALSIDGEWSVTS